MDPPVIHPAARFARGAVVGGRNLQLRGKTLDAWLQKDGAQLFEATNATLKVSKGPQERFVVRFKPAAVQVLAESMQLQEVVAATPRRRGCRRRLVAGFGPQTKQGAATFARRGRRSHSWRRGVAATRNLNCMDSV